jgi:hypothetical protein
MTRATLTRIAIGVLTLLAALPGGGSAAAEPTGKPTAVVAVLDTGINPYHAVFRDRSAAAQQHPSTRFPGYPRSAKALRISLDIGSYKEAVEQDCDLWRGVVPGQLYWFPGTTVVGAISFSPAVKPDCTSAFGGLQLLDRNGHGTMTASRAVGRTHGACRGCPVVAVTGFNRQAVEWTGSQAAWLDAESHSWGAFLPAWVPAEAPIVAPNNLSNDPAFVRAVEKSAQAHLAFWASGNGIATRGGVLGHPTQVDPRLTPSVLSVGGHDSGRVITWPDAPPHLASDACDSWAAKHDSTTAEADNVGGGTSGATPYVAGGALAVLIEARRLLGDSRTGVRGSGADAVVAQGRPGRIQTGPLADGRLTLGEWRRVLLTTATARPKASPDDGPPCVTSGAGLYSATPVEWSDVPPSFPGHLLIGYGAVDPPALATARAALAGRSPLPARAQEDEFFARDAEVRARLHQVFRGG